MTQEDSKQKIPVNVRLLYSGKNERLKAANRVVLSLPELSNAALNRAIRAAKLPDMCFAEPNFEPDELTAGAFVEMVVIDPE